MAILGLDWSARMATRFGARLYSASFAKVTAGALTEADAAGAPANTTATYTCKGIAFGYSAEFISGELVKIGDYRVMILLGTIAAAVDDGVQAELDLSTLTDNVDTVIRAIADGTDGNAITIELVADGATGAGALLELVTNVRISYLADVTTVADIEALLASSTLVEVETAGTGASVLDAGDAFASAPLAGGVDASTAQAPGIIPNAGDTVSIPPPGQTVAKTGTVVRVESVSQASVTIHVRGVSL